MEGDFDRVYTNNVVNVACVKEYTWSFSPEGIVSEVL